MSSIGKHVPLAGFEAYADDLMARFPYQFAGDGLGASVAAGWASVFFKLCEDIDALLGENKRGFRWLQVKEKWGAMCCYFTTARAVEGETTPDEQRLIHALRKLISEAESQTQHLCAACGEPCEADRSTGWLLALCEEHKHERWQAYKRATEERKVSEWGSSIWIELQMPDHLKRQDAGSPYGSGAGLATKTAAPNLKRKVFHGDELGKKD